MTAKAAPLREWASLGWAVGLLDGPLRCGDVAGVPRPTRIPFDALARGMPRPETLERRLAFLEKTDALLREAEVEALATRHRRSLAGLWIDFAFRTGLVVLAGSLVAYSATPAAVAVFACVPLADFVLKPLAGRRLRSLQSRLLTASREVAVPWAGNGDREFPATGL